MIGSACPPKSSASDGDAAPRLIGCVCTVPRHGASCLARIDGSISLDAVIPISSRTSCSFGWTGVFVMMCQKHVRLRTFCGSVAHGAAAVYVWPWMVRLVGAIVGSTLWTTFGSSYVPGTLALIGSPFPEVLRMMNCAPLLAPGHGAAT